jgi:hypothetical protein
VKLVYEERCWTDFAKTTFMSPNVKSLSHFVKHRGIISISGFSATVGYVPR